MTPPRPLGRLRLGVNIDHVATVRNARGGPCPDPLRAARLAEAAGADGITAHLREDRRHITDADIDGARREPDAAAQPRDGRDRRDAGDRAPPPPARRLPRARAPRGAHHRGRARGRAATRPASPHFIAPLREAGCRVSIFIAPDRRQIEAAAPHRRAGRSSCTPAPTASADLAGDAAARDAELRPARRDGRLRPRPRARGPRRPRPDLRQRRPGRRDPRGDGAQHRPFPDRRGDLRPASTPPSAACAPRWTRRAPRPSAGMRRQADRGGSAVSPFERFG